ncbi:MAG: hypothetical protein NC209_00645 [Alistipes sp.]|nr:hypothetical protein [Alistipes senegalensis]MCM1249641.1 hypothetical protein [Alistipes sp.]
MNLKEIRSELQKLSELAAGWPSLQRIAPLERDLALEKLRMLYDTLRFGAGPAVLPPAHKAVRPGSASSAAGAPVSPAVEEPRRVIRVEAVEYEDPDIEMVDLSEVLSLDDEEFAEPEAAESQPADAEPRFRRPAEPERPLRAEKVPAAHAHPAAPAPLSEPEEDEEYGPEIIEFVPDPDPFVGPVPKKEPTPPPTPAPAPAPVRKPAPAPQPAAAPAPTSAPRPLIIPKPRPVPEPAPRRVPADEPVPVPQPAPASEPAAAPIPVREPVAGSTSDSGQAVSAAPAEIKEIGKDEIPHVAATSPAEEVPTLFDPDDAAMRHRHKQRVIMSLYDPAPAAAPASATERLPKEPAAAPAVSNTPNVRVARPVAPESPAAPDPEIELLDARTEEPIAAAPVSDPETHVLGEVINQDVHTLAETIAAPHASVRLGAPIVDLRQAIGINDKFLMIRDLFGGDGSLFDATVEALNAQESLDDCMIYIAEHFSWNPESDSAKLVMELLERKFA